MSDRTVLLMSDIQNGYRRQDLRGPSGGPLSGGLTKWSTGALSFLPRIARPSIRGNRLALLENSLRTRERPNITDCVIATCRR